MSDTSTQTTPAQLREAYERSKAAEEAATAENARLARENLFLKAGIATDDDGPGQLLFEAWGDGSLDELKAKALKVGALKPPPTTTDEPTPTPTSEQAPTTPAKPGEPSQPGGAQQAFQEMHHSGESHGGSEAPSVHPRDAALEQYHKDLTEGMTTDEARQKAMASVLGAAMKGDKRMLLDQESHRERALEYDQGRQTLR